MSDGMEVDLGMEVDVWVNIHLRMLEVEAEVQIFGGGSSDVDVEDTKSTGSIEITGLSNLKELAGKSVLVVDDIVDSGLTLSHLLSTLKDVGVAKVWTSVLLSKRVTRKVDVQEDFVAFNIPDKFIVGYGLDYNQIFRDLNHICIINETGIEKYKKK